MNARVLLLLVIVALLATIASSQALGWTLINAKIRRDFPAVKRITTAELAAWLNDPKRQRPLLLDVRTRAEYDVSHLPDAQHVEPDSTASTIRQAKDHPIVTYCSVGYRSGAFADRLRVAGFTGVVNLEGSIFRWANEGRPIVREGQKVEKVHPYSGTWGLLLQKRLRADLPAATGSSAN